MSLKNKVLNYLNTNKSAQGSLVAVVAASVILSVIVASATQWYLAFNKSLNVSGDSLTGMSIAKDIWDKMTTQDFEDMKAKAGTTETNNVGGYTVTKEYGNAGVFDESTGECKVGSSTPTAENPRACMDVTIKVTDKDGKQVFTATPTRVSQNMGNFYVKNGNFPKDFQVKLEDEDETAEIPEGKALYAYVDGQKVPLSSQGNATSSDTFNLSVKVPDTPSGAAKKKLFDVSLAGDETKTYSIPASYGYGFIELSGGNYHDSVSGYVHDAKISVDHASSTVTIENESFGTGYEWSHGGSFTYPTTLNTTAYFIPYIKAHTETRTFTLKELLQLVVDNHISE